MAQWTGTGEPARTLSLLWRVHGEDQPHPGPRRGLSLDEVVGAAIKLADAEGLAAVTMRRVARGVGVAPMTLYTYVPGKPELVDLMVDEVFRLMNRTPLDQRSWRERVRVVAVDNLSMLRRHPWIIEVSTVRPPLGPGLLAKYDWELGAFENLGLSDVDMDAAVTLVLAFVRSIALGEIEMAAAQRESKLDDGRWWEIAGPLLARVVDERSYTTAARVGAAAGAAHGAAYSPDYAFRFGLEAILDGLAASTARPTK